MTAARDPNVWTYDEVNCLYNAWCYHNAPEAFSTAYEARAISTHSNKQKRVYFVFSRLLEMQLTYDLCEILCQVHRSTKSTLYEKPKTQPDGLPPV